MKSNNRILYNVAKKNSKVKLAYQILKSNTKIKLLQIADNLWGIFKTRQKYHKKTSL